LRITRTHTSTRSSERYSAEFSLVPSLPLSRTHAPTINPQVTHVLVLLVSAGYKTGTPTEDGVDVMGAASGPPSLTHTLSLSPAPCRRDLLRQDSCS